jgi:DNA repair exonuclease SbcCD nuclease subunit
MIDSTILNKPVKRIWILGDMHLGVRSNSMEWLDIQKDFYENLFIPTLQKNVREGDILVQVGDAFDNRQSINLKVLNYAVDLFERLGEILPTHVICGNHDIWAKKSNDVTSIDSLKWIPNVAIYKDPELFNWGGKKVLLMPWRRDAAHEAETLAEYPTANIVFCHSEVKGIKLNSKVTNDHGSDSQSFDRYDAVYSGHIHYRQKKGKLRMVGTPYQLTRSDANNAKGFDLVNLEDMSETFFENNISPKFIKTYLTGLYNVPLGEFKEEIRNNFVDLYVPSNIAASNALSKLINKIQEIGRKIEPNIYEQDTFIDKDMYDMDEIEDLYKNYNILHLCNMYIDGLGHDDETKAQIKDKIKKLHDLCAYNYDSDQ